MKESSKGVYRRLLRYIVPYRFAFFLGILGSVVYSGVDAYFTHLINPLIQKGFIHQDPHFIMYLPIVIVGIFLLRGIASFAASYFMAKVGRDVVLTLRNQMFKHLNKIPANFYDTSTSGQLLSKIIYNVDQVAEASTNAVTTAVQLYFVAIPLIAIIVRWSSKRMRRVSGRVQDSLGSVTHVAEETIEGYREVRTYGGQAYETKKFAGTNRDNRNQALKVVITKSISTASVQLLGAAVLAFTIFLATKLASQQGITAGDFVSLLFAMVMLLKPLKDITNVNNIIQQGIAGAKSVFDLLDHPAEPDTGTIQLPRTKGKIAYENVCFSYDSSSKATLNNINFTVEPGKTVALVGRSGGGKSTLISLLPRFYDIDSGSITIDDISIHDATLTSLRNQFAIVSQHVTLFNDTIAHNVAYGNLEKATEAEIWQAIDGAHARTFVESLPDGLNTIVGQNGVLLSGGQRQRIAIARAILKDAPILILDEATSALDTEAERHIQAAFDELMKTRTTLVIAHRLSTIENADNIMVINGGEIAEMGTHDELLAKAGHYAKLYNIQFGESNE